MAETLGPDGFFEEVAEPVRRYFRTKTSRPSWHWLDTATEEHAHAFTVARTAGYDVLEDIRAALDEAIVNQESFETFRDRLEPILKAKGWWGRQIGVDSETGEPEVSQLGSVRRLRTIYWANVFSSHAAGEWERIQNTKRVLPFLRYLETTAEDPREEHLGWVGTILPVDDPWWDTHFPPNGWGCECSVEQISRFRATKLGYDPSKPAPASPTRTWVNKRTGRRTEVPEGIDPGWEGNPGKTRRKVAQDLLNGRIDRLPPEARPGAASDVVNSPAFVDHHDRAVAIDRRRREEERELIDGGMERDAAEAEAALRHPWSLGSMPVAVVPKDLGPLRPAADVPASDLVVVTDRSIGHGHSRHPTKAGDWALVQEILERGEIHVEQDRPGEIWGFRRFAGRDWMVKLAHDAELGRWFVSTFFSPARSGYRANQARKEGRKIFRGEKG